MRSALTTVLLVTMLVMSAGFALAFELNIKADQEQSTVGEAVYVTVNVTNNSIPVNNTLVNISTSIGNLSVPFSYTNISGIARFWVNSTLSGIATINATANSTSNNISITFVAAPTASIQINSSSISTEVGNVSNVYLTALDEYGNTNTSANMSIEIIITDLFGDVKDMSTTINRTPYTQTNISINQDNITFTDSATASSSVYLRFNSTLAGNITLNVSVGGVSNVTSLYYTPGPPNKTIIVYDNEYTVNTTSDISVSVYDEYLNPVSNTTVVFNATPPVDTDYNSPLVYNSLDLQPNSTTTSLVGIAYSSFRTDKRAGANTVNISVLNTPIQTITITGLADQIDGLLLSHTPTDCYANNVDKYRLSAKTADQFLNPVLPGGFPIKEQVFFTSSSGSVLIPLNQYGIATMMAGPTPYVENITITATYKNESGYTNVNNSTTLEFIAGDLATLNFYANPDIVLTQNQSGNHNATLFLTALDEWGHYLPFVNITLNNTNSSLGTLSMSGINTTNLINATTNSNGRLNATFTSNNTDGNVTFVASNGLINTSTIVKVSENPFLSISVTAEPDTVNPGDIVNVTTIITVEGNLPISRASATAMLVLDRSGSMDPDSYAGTPLDVVLVMDRSGSMSGTPIADAKTAAKIFMDSLVSNAQVGLVSFASSSTVDQGLISLNSFNNKKSIWDAIDALIATGSTAMGNGMADANNELINYGRKDAQKIMIVLTDGESNSGNDTQGIAATSIAKANHIKIYTIGLGSGSSTSTTWLKNIASGTGGEYFYAPNSSDLEDIYYSIAQSISDYDVTEVEYGTDGFTSYDYASDRDSYNLTTNGSQYIYEDTFTVNDTLNDLKVYLDWGNTTVDMNLSLISPAGLKYGANENTTGYYFGEGYEYIWIAPLSYTYPDSDTEIVEVGNWTIRVTADSGTETFNVSTYIDKKTAIKLASSSFMSSFNESDGDQVGLILYSNDNVEISNTQTSYVRNGSEWVSYFTVNNDAYYTINLSWNDPSDFNITLYEGTEVLNLSTGGSQFESLSSQLSGGIDYHVVVSKVSGQNDTQFMINVSSSPLRKAVSAYYEDNDGTRSVPRYRLWGVNAWGSEVLANSVDANIQQLIMASSTSRDEIIMGTVDSQYDANFQIFSDSTWGTVEEFSTSLDSYSTRGFDIAYESISGDALVVYGIDNSVPKYKIWNGSSWFDAGAVNGTNSGAGDIRWIELAFNPLSDEMVLVTLDDKRDIRAQVWDGSSWSNTLSITDSARTYSYRCFDVAYEQVSGDAIVVWSDTEGYVHSRIWDGSAWGTENDLYMFDSLHMVYWIKMASDVNSDNIVMGDQNSDDDIYVSVWNGSSWSSRLQMENNCYEYSKRIFDVAFETLSGEAMIVWGDSTIIPKYRTWNGTWSAELSAISLDDYTRWVQLRQDPLSNGIFLMTSDANNDINIQQWNGSQWGSRSEVESSSSNTYENFDLVFQNYADPSSQAFVNWKEWRATVTSSLVNDSLSHLVSAIGGMTAEGLTAIDEGIYEANNELSSVSGNSTMVLMTDGIDNAGYHSLIAQAERARDQNTVIHTVGFGNSESEVDPVLFEIANITGGKYYFAPNSSVLKNIFVGIAAEITNFTAFGPTLTIHIPHNYDTGYSSATVDYVTNSTNSTTGNITFFTVPTDPGIANAEPNVTIIGDRKHMFWQLPSMGLGDKWGVWYQLKMIQGAGYVPLILPTSSASYTDVNGSIVDIPITFEGDTEFGGGGIPTASVPLGKVLLSTISPIILVDDETSTIRITLTDLDGNPASADILVCTTLGSINGNPNCINLFINGSDTFNFMSTTAGNAYLSVFAANNGNPLADTMLVVVRPKGHITIS
ncbi:MAG: VWA domain-containing protein [Methanosarcinaceae archaeon]|nr:VWA domain-containing protein [Methanosarcinaceae archaeon]